MNATQYELIESVCKQPGMYVCPGTLDGVVAYIDGMNTCTGCLGGFREWLVTRFDDGDNLAWSGLFKMLIRTEVVCEEDQIERLGSLLKEFNDFLGSCHSRSEAHLRIYLRYHAWLLNRPWYTPDSPWYVAPYDGLSIPKHHG